jgi:enamine deaminase RidA (YjgF/YER057c/UK114 family)
MPVSAPLPNTMSTAMNSKRIAYLESLDASARRFPNALRIGDTIYVSSEPIGASARSGSPDIQDQTHEAFSAFVELLEQVGARMADLVKLHTFFVFDGEAGATAYWERMTQVRLQYFANPGPAGTALRVKGAPTRARLIAIDGVASVSPARQRIMPAHAWDWSMPTPLSQGWRIGPVLYAGGQISADRNGRTVAADDLTQQAINTMEFLRHVLEVGGAGFDDVVSLKIAYQHRGDDRAARAVLDAILRVVHPLVRPGQCTLTCLGVDLLYEGLKLEIDAMAVLGDAAKRMRAGHDEGWCGAAGFATACRVDDLIYLGAIGAPEEGSLGGQLRRSLQRMQAALHEVGSGMDDVAKLNVLFASTDEREDADYQTLQALLAQQLPTPGPVVTLVRVAGLPQNGQRVQVDGVAVIRCP